MKTAKQSVYARTADKTAYRRETAKEKLCGLKTQELRAKSCRSTEFITNRADA